MINSILIHSGLSINVSIRVQIAPPAFAAFGIGSISVCDEDKDVHRIAVVERTCQMQDSQGQIMALAFRKQLSKTFSVVPPLLGSAEM